MQRRTEEFESVKRKRIIVILIVAAIAGGAALFWSELHKDDSLQGSGTIEARNIRVGSKVGGRIDQVLVREGDRVHTGQVLVTFDDKEMAAELEQSKATSDKMARGYRPEEIAEA